jgi:hypothetical protein
MPGQNDSLTSCANRLSWLIDNEIFDVSTTLDEVILRCYPLGGLRGNGCLPPEITIRSWWQAETVFICRYFYCLRCWRLVAIGLKKHGVKCLQKQ